MPANLVNTAQRQVLIIHGWSDTSKSFHTLAEFLEKNNYQAKQLWLGDYISMDDDVRVADVGKRMAEVIDELMQTGELAASFDVIVHSTGGLVAREWLTTHYKGRAEQCPMKRLVMLAPANYGSKLAATGKSFLGRVVKGYNNWFQTGKSMLNDLELASPYQWELAQRDILVGPEALDAANPVQFYGDDKVWPFVIVGTHPYASLLRQIVNENGADGTVRACAANLNAQGVTIDFREQDSSSAITNWVSRLQSDIPLAVLPTRTHGSIIDPDRAETSNHEDIAETPEQLAQLGLVILQALGCDSFPAYQLLQTQWHDLSEATAALSKTTTEEPEFFHQYLQVNCNVVDDQGKPVTDYFLEFFADTKRNNTDANVYLHANVIEDVKTNSQNPALRNLYFDRTDLMEGYYPLLPKGTEQVLYMSISAASPGNNINYFEREKVGSAMQIPLHFLNENQQRWLKRNSTHFLQIIIPRIPNTNVFKLTNLG
ncbi:esterase/lipase family protein [Undibacterium sp. Xuan67W]|uniref:esterase/lipase family protein n=1 Tax=Undibacterium sp. Xuan67W TaxID=3413057 RepID=UPI003BF23A81